AAKYNVNDNSFSSQLLKIKAKNPDVIFIPGNYEESARIIKEARSLGIKTQFLGDDLWQNNSFISIGGASVEGVVFPTFFDEKKPLTDESKKFITEYTKTYNQSPTFFAANAYDAYLMVINAIKNANSTDPTSIKNALAKTTDMKGATGYITIDINRDSIKDVPLLTVNNGAFVSKDTVKSK
ncbi:MAG: ABC transporter substrate-binding protein, partial [Oscillospiraceae bacterium]|nr:ABC transporter substrate-binding protein [Oscillospiraceae bacterium]